MKKLLFAYAFCCIAALPSFAQSVIKEVGGNVGIAIGTDNPQSVLEVGGTVIARGGFYSIQSAGSVGGLSP